MKSIFLPGLLISGIKSKIKRALLFICYIIKMSALDHLTLLCYKRQLESIVYDHIKSFIDSYRKNLCKFFFV